MRKYTINLILLSLFLCLILSSCSSMKRIVRTSEIERFKIGRSPSEYFIFYIAPFSVKSGIKDKNLYTILHLFCYDIKRHLSNNYNCLVNHHQKYLGSVYDRDKFLMIDTIIYDVDYLKSVNFFKFMEITYMITGRIISNDPLRIELIIIDSEFNETRIKIEPGQDLNNVKTYRKTCELILKYIDNTLDNHESTIDLKMQDIKINLSQNHKKMYKEISEVDFETLILFGDIISKLYRGNHEDAFYTFHENYTLLNGCIYFLPVIAELYYRNGLFIRLEHLHKPLEILEGEILDDLFFWSSLYKKEYMIEYIPSYSRFLETGKNMLLTGTTILQRSGDYEIQKKVSLEMLSYFPECGHVYFYVAMSPLTFIKDHEKIPHYINPKPTPLLDEDFREIIKIYHSVNPEFIIKAINHGIPSYLRILASKGAITPLILKYDFQRISDKDQKIFVDIYALTDKLLNSLTSDYFLREDFSPVLLYHLLNDLKLAYQKCEDEELGEELLNLIDRTKDLVNRLI